MVVLSAGLFCIGKELATHLYIQTAMCGRLLLEPSRVRIIQQDLIQAIFLRL